MNPDILLSLVGVAGLVSVAATALLARDTVKDLIGGLGDRIDKVNASISKEKIQGIVGRGGDAA